MNRRMARTPLFAAVDRALRIARAAERAGVPVPEAVEREREARSRAGGASRPAASPAMSRRRFLAAGATAAAGLALPGCVTRYPRGAVAAPGPGGDPVIVVGAGIAGLTAAYRLAAAGVPVVVIEAQDRVGGRMWSLRDRFADGQVVELGGELIDTGHTAIRGLADELGIALDDLSREVPALSTDLWFFGGRRRSDAEVVEAFRFLVPRIDEALATIEGDGSVTYDAPAGAEPLDRTSLAEWLDGAGVSGWFRDLLDVAYTTEYGLETGEQSALNFLLMIDPEPEPFRIFGESDERFRVHEGNDAIPGELARRLGDRVRTATLLEAVRRGPDGRLRCSLRSGGTSREMAAGHVVLAIPFTLLRDVRLDLDLPEVKRRAIADLGYGTNAKLMAGFSERMWRTRHGSNGSVVTDLPFQLVWETSRGQEGRAGVLTNFTGGRHGVEVGKGTAAAQAERLVAGLDRVFPGVAAAHAGMEAVRFHWPSFRWSRGSYASYRVGQWTSIAGAEGERVENLLFAGEHCSLEAQGFMEGGCETGERAAREVLADLGIAAPAAATRSARHRAALRGAA